MNEFEAAAQAAATAWKQRTATLPDEARAAAPYFTKDGPRGRYDYCLPRAFASHNLFPDVRQDILGLFAQCSIAWQAELDGGPTNHLLSSQVQCANALARMMSDGDLVKRAFGDALPIDRVLTIEADRYLTFEYIGDRSHLGEWLPGVPPSRGKYNTSVDAAFRYTRADGAIEIALVEWKFTEHPDGGPLSTERSISRRDRYRSLVERDDAPFDLSVIPYEDMFVEPFYQLMRQQLLADAMERTRERDVTVVRVVHVSPTANHALHACLYRDSHRGAGSTLYDAWTAALRRPDRFVVVPSERFLDPELTSAEYVDRYDVRI